MTDDSTVVRRYMQAYIDLGGGTKLPFRFEIARACGVPVVVVEEVKRQLRQEGLLDSRRGRGYHVAPAVNSLQPRIVAWIIVNCGPDTEIATTESLAAALGAHPDAVDAVLTELRNDNWLREAPPGVLRTIRAAEEYYERAQAWMNSRPETAIERLYAWAELFSALPRQRKD